MEVSYVEHISRNLKETKAMPHAAQFTPKPNKHAVTQSSSLT